MKVKACLYCGNKNPKQITARVDGIGILRCVNCGLMMVDEIRNDMEGLYNSEYFEKEKPSKIGYNNYFSNPVANLIGKYAFAKIFCNRIDTHLDLGAADGSLVELFKADGVNSFGLEYSKEAVALAKAKELNVSQSDISNLDIFDTKFDIITAFDLLEHLSAPKLALKQIYDNLDDNGFFIFSTLSVKNNDESEFWFRNSLEHFIYFNRDNLSFILENTFGKGNFEFFEVINNGISEFFGVAKKKKLTKVEVEKLKLLISDKYPKNNARDSFYYSLFYNQISKFDKSREIIKYLTDIWPKERLIIANFFNLYFQGAFEKAYQAVVDINFSIAVSNAAFWQALTHVERVLFELNENKQREEIFNLRQDLFKTREELSYLHQSRIVGNAIKLRDFLRAMPHIFRKKISLLKRRIAMFIPNRLKGKLKRCFNHKNFVKTQIIDNKSWEKGKPLFSIVTPFYNHGETIKETVKSVLAQTFQDFEYIIVNDGSDMANTNILGDVKDKKISVIHHGKNLGQGSPAAARNTGVKNANGKYIICLDADDTLDSTFIDKAVVVLETDPEVALVTTHMNMFGVKSEIYKNTPYNPLYLYSNNMVITAAPYRKEAWDAVGGYNTTIGYEDWEYWLKLAEHGYWGKLIPEALLNYRTALSSRYVEDMGKHKLNVTGIRGIHVNYKKIIKRLIISRRFVKKTVNPSSAFINLSNPEQYKNSLINGKKNILIVIPWMTFGGAETLIHNYTNEIKDNFNISFVTTLKGENEWEYKFKEVTDAIYHLPNLFDDREIYIEFILNYIRTRKIDILHGVHIGYDWNIFQYLPRIKKEFPDLKIVLTFFNDNVPLFDTAVNSEANVDKYIADNQNVVNRYLEKMPASKTRVIPNGVDSTSRFNPSSYDREKMRTELNILKNDVAVFFVGRISEEKKPDVFLEVAKLFSKDTNNGDIKFFMIGDGPMRPQIESDFDKIPNFTYLGYQSEIAKYLSAADVFVLPSRIEGFPLSILEAMSMEVAVVASRVGAVPDILIDGQDGFVVTPCSVNEIYESVAKLNKDRDLLDKMKKKGRIEVEEKYSNLILGKNYVNLYNEELK